MASATCLSALSTPATHASLRVAQQPAQVLNALPARPSLLSGLEISTSRRRAATLVVRSPLITRAQSGDDSKKGSSGDSKEKVPTWAKPDSSEPPPWARKETVAQRDKPFELPFWAYLLFSTNVAIAAVGSIFEYTAGNAIFGVLPNDNPLWAPILLTFGVTGFPTAGYLLYLAIQSANKASQEADDQDGMN